MTEPGNRWSRRGASLWALAVITALALALRLYRLDHQALWYDEVLTFLMARASLQELSALGGWHARWHSLYYGFMHAVLELGGRSGIMLRLPSVLLGTATVPAMYRVASFWFPRRIGLASAFLLAISPLHLYYSQEARPYAALLLLSLVALAFLQKALADQIPRASWVGFAIATIMALYTHPVALAFVAWCGLYAWVQAPPARRFRVILVFATIGLAWVIGPLLASRVVLPQGVSVTRSRSDLYSMAYTLWTFAAGFSVGPSVRELHGPDRVRIAISSAPVVVPILLVYGGLLAVGVKCLWRDNRRLCLVIASWILFVMSLAVVVDLSSQLLFNVRYVLLAYPACLMLVAIGTRSLRSRLVRGAAWGVLAVVSLVSVVRYAHNPRYERDDYRSAAAFLQAAARPGDLVIVCPPSTVKMFAYYDPGEVRLRAYAFSHKALEDGRVASDFRAMTKGTEGFWVILRTVTPARELGDALADRYRVERTLEWPGVRLLRFATSPDG